MIETPKFNDERPVIKNILADRYASRETLEIFSEENKILSERKFWIEVMQAQHDLGLNIPQKNIDDYRKIKDQIDLMSIRKRELKLRHDEKARIEEFNALAGHENAHEGLTSRDVSDNLEQAQIKRGLSVIRTRTVATLARFATSATETYGKLVYAGRTHMVPSQPDLIGRLFSNAGEELLLAHQGMENLIENYPLRGIKGAQGTQTDQLQLFGQDQKKVDELEKRVANSLGFKKILGSVGQIYPRSLDFVMVSTLYQLVCGPASLAETLRIMASKEEFTEGFKLGQVGSSAMPHKMNSRTLERACAQRDILDGYLTMAKNVAGRQKYGGDVSDSATRRVFIPDSFFVTDGFFQSILTVLDEAGFYPAVIEKELNTYLPFLTSTRLLMAAVDAGVGREKAHEAIKRHAVGVALEMREKGEVRKGILDRLAEDPSIGLKKEIFEKALSSPIEFVGSAPKQIKGFVSKVNKIVKKYPEAANYKPEEIL
jgi:adenylosuccinate lyase